nr:class I SAM-dependent methyltransferase [uncultured Rhodopila sp.]
MLTMLAPAPRKHTTAAPDCRLCGAPLHTTLLDLGPQPVATSGLAAGETEVLHPLHIRLCNDCGLAQTSDIPAGAVADPAFAEPAARPGRYAETLRDRFRLGTDSLVIDLSPAESPLLSRLQAAGIPGFAIDPAVFGTDTAMKAAVERGCADVLVAHDVLPHAPDLFDFAAGLACILRPNGVLSLQFPHLLSLLQGVQFDAFRHDTHTYLSLPVTQHLLRSVGLRVFDAERLPEDGGCLRIQACHAHSPHPARHGLKAVRLAEAEAEAQRPALYRQFAGRVAVAREDILGFLRDRRRAGRVVAACGATARGSALLNNCGITTNEIACVAEAEPNRHGRWLAGCRIPVVPMEMLAQRAPDDIIILPWFAAAQLAVRLQPLRQAGTQLWRLLPRIERV